MPEYAYHCRRCDKSFTARMHVQEHDERLPDCPECGKNDSVEKMLAPVTVVTSRKSASW